MVASLRAVIVFPTLSGPRTCVGWGRVVTALKHHSGQPLPHPWLKKLPPLFLSAAGSKSLRLPQTHSCIHPKRLPHPQQRRHPSWILRVPQLPFQSCRSPPTWACHCPNHPLGEFYPLPEVSGMDSFPLALPINSQPSSHLSRQK